MFSNIMAVIFLGLVAYLIISDKSDVDAKEIREQKKNVKEKKIMRGVD